MLRGRVARQRGGRQRVLSAINAKECTAVWALRQARPLAYVTSHKPRGRGEFPPELGA
jgi:hypothetical protein